MKNKLSTDQSLNNSAEKSGKLVSAVEGGEEE
jgi:hypothetical protein